MAYPPTPSGDALQIRFLPGSYAAPGAGDLLFVLGDKPTVFGKAWASVGLDAAGGGAFVPPPVSGAAAGQVGVDAFAAGAHGVGGAALAHLSIGSAAAGQVARYEVRGIVRDGAALVDRRVRVYLRSSGELVAQADTVSGAFRIPVGAEAGEYTIVPIDMTGDATDWSPPCANRVVSVLVVD